MPFNESTPARSVTLALRILHTQGKTDVARQLIDQQAARCGEDAEFLAVAGLVHLDGKDLAKAEEFSRAALAKGARPVEALLVGGTTALLRRDAQVAQAFFEEGLRASPNEPRLFAGLGMARMLA